MSWSFRYRVLVSGLLCASASAAAEPSSPAVSASPPAPAQPAATSPAGAATAPHSTEAEFLVSSQGGAFEVPIHLGEVCILSFPSRLNGDVMTNTPDFRGKLWEAKAWGD